MPNREIVFKTRWFGIEKIPFGNETPYYGITMPEGVMVFAQTTQNQIVLVKQWRPVLNRYTLEFPAGYIDEGECPADAAKRELFEETGFRCGKVFSLCSGHLIMSRINSRLHGFWAPEVIKDVKFNNKESTEIVLVTKKELRELILDGRFQQLAAIALMQIKEWINAPNFR